MWHGHGGSRGLAWKKFGINRLQWQGKDDGGEAAAQRASSCKAFALLEVSVSAGVGLAPAPIWVFANLVERGDRVNELWSGEQEEAARVSANFVERVFDVEEKQDARGLFTALMGGVDEEVVLGLCFVNNEFEAAFDGDSVLSCWCV